MRSEVKRLPELFLERLRRIIPPQKLDSVLNTFAESRPATFRTNTLKIYPDILQEKLEHQGFRLQKVAWYPGAFILRGGTLRELQKTESYLKGEIYVQSLSSMLPALVLDPQAGETILDLTAAPGSKTTQLSCLMRGEGRIVANDNNKIRFFKLKANVELQSAPNVELSMRGGEIFGRDYPAGFDRILLDAPCSAEGRFDVHEPSSFRYWKPAKVKEMMRKQRMLFASAFHALRPGGTMVYSTCTFAPEENEGVLHWAIDKFGEKITMEPVQFHFPNQMPGLAKWEMTGFHPPVHRSVRVLPTADMDGFFVAKIVKSR